MSMISYAQNHEDVLLRRVFPEGTAGFYIDVGANDPIRDSVTKHFYDQGWHGINVEPATTPYAALCAQRERDVNLNVGISSREGTLEFLECASHHGLSTFSPRVADTCRKRGMVFHTRSVPVTSLARMCEQYVDRPIDFLKIDVEAHEREVIEGGDWHRWRPRVVVVETNRAERWEPIILAADYRFATFDGLNRYYVRSEDRQLLPALQTPVHVCDDYVPYRYQCRIEELSVQLASAHAKTEELHTNLLSAQRMAEELAAHLALR
jgi:FkbM family methyltransferase